MRQFRQIEAEMRLLVHLLALPGVSAVIGKARFHRGIHHRQKRAGPQELLLRLEPQIRQRLVVLLAHLAVDVHEPLHQIALDLVLRIDLVHHPVQIHRSPARCVLLRNFFGNTLYQKLAFAIAPDGLLA